MSESTKSFTVWEQLIVDETRAVSKNTSSRNVALVALDSNNLRYAQQLYVKFQSLQTHDDCIVAARSVLTIQ